MKLMAVLTMAGFGLAACGARPAGDAASPKAMPEETQASDGRDRAGAKTTTSTTTEIKIVFEDGRNGIDVRVTAAGLTPGTHGMHVHEVGRCDEPSFTSAGPHWNPTAKRHGRDNPAGAHLGDLPNIVIGADGRGAASGTIAGAKLSEGSNPMFDDDGAALLIHAKADDYRTDPGGDSGDRIACSVVAAPR